MSEAPTLCEHSTYNTEVATAELEARLGTYDPDSLETPAQEPAEVKPVSWDGPYDPKNPQNWSSSKKWLVMSVNAIVTVNVTYASAAPVNDTLRIASHFHKSTTLGYLITSMFLFGYVFGPIIWGPSSELLGRRGVLLVAFSIYLLTFIGQALAHNMETLLIMRFFGGVFGSAPLATGAGILADMWDVSGRTIPSAVFLTSVFIGPSLATIAGGFMTQSGLSWRWPIWVAMIYSGVCLLLLYFLIPETYEPVLLQRKARKLRKVDPVGNKDVYAEHERGDWSLRGVIRRTVLRPIEMVLREKILVLVTIYLSFVYGVLYALFEALPVVFVAKRNFSVAHLGLIYVAVSIGILLGGAIYVWLLRDLDELAKKWEGFPPPENRLSGAIIGGPLLMIGCFWLGWTGEYSIIPWYVPMLSTIFIGCGVNLVFAAFSSYMTDTYLMYTSSAFAVNTVFRCALGAAFPLFTTAMFEGMGVNWACTLLGLVSLILCPIPIVFLKFGAQIRGDSHFAPGFDLKISARLNEKEAEITPSA
ncbi:MFS general substrate transporter [Thelephora terrestris]|uniref:MFS general substrate transporter n=1 Tax=Thelephora terrestris TaxID=56493 RepID=A0A9P6HJW5_9AGAM|nr:MFS general substrate transporter [Thelephora terrestris]